MKQLSKNGEDFIQACEGTVLRNGKHVPYTCPTGHWTIGYGHLLSQSEFSSGKITLYNPTVKTVDYRHGLTEEEADQIFRGDVMIAVQCVNNSVDTDKLTQDQFDALVDFVFNLGTTAFANSTLRRVINMGGSAEEICNQIKRWNKGRDPKTNETVILKGLKRRREAECSLWSS